MKKSEYKGNQEFIRLSSKPEYLAAGRLLYGMGKDDAIPKKFFAYVNPKTRIPSKNIILVGILTLIGAFVLTFLLDLNLLILALLLHSWE